MSWFFLCQIESFPNYFPSWFFLLGSPRYHPFVHKLLVPSFLSLFCNIGLLRRTYMSFISCASWCSFELSPSHPSCVACLEDLEPLATFGYPRLVLSTGFLLIFWSWQAVPIFFSSLCLFLRPILSWVLGFRSFGLTIIFPCDELNHFDITFYGVGLLCYFFWDLGVRIF